MAAAYAKARRANEIADEVLAGIRTAAEQQAALAARLDTSIRGAQATVTRASDYVATRRGGVGGEARTRLAEAARHLDQAVAAGAADPAAGIREAEAASRLANEALAIAQRDYGGWDDPWRGGRGGGGRRGRRGRGRRHRRRDHRRDHRRDALGRRARRRLPGRWRRLGWRRVRRWSAAAAAAEAGAAEAVAAGERESTMSVGGAGAVPPTDGWIQPDTAPR